MIWLLLGLASLAAWAFLALGRGGFWRASERLEPAPEPAAWPPVIALIPARNEAETIAAVTRAHAATDYPGEFSLVIIDDGSDDGTADLARDAAKEGLRKVEVIEAPPLDPGWSGKLAALNAGLNYVAGRPVKFILFTDADILHAPATLRRLVAKAEAEGHALASLMARLDARGRWGELLIPAFVYFFQKLYPFPLSNDRASNVAAGAGGCMLVSREALAAAGGIEAIKDRLIDDCALAERLKLHGEGAPRPTWIGLAADEAVSLRDNRSFASIWAMVARTAFTQLHHSWFLLAGTLAGMMLVYLAPPLVALSYPLHRETFAGAFALAAWMMMAATFLPTLRLYGLPRWRAFLLPAAAFLYSLMTLASALRRLRGGGGLWKGRVYR
jgi:hopene-associated glycosyltransferase HpnB